MGTRNLTIVIIDGETKIAQYGQWDGYPAGQGKTILSFLKRIDAAGEWQKFKDRIRTLKWLTPEQCEELDKDPDWDKKHPYLSRDCGGQILDAVYFGTMETGSNYDNTRKEYAVFCGNRANFDLYTGAGNGGAAFVADISQFATPPTNFLTDGLFCEWAYRIDLDKETFEILRSGDNVIKTYQLSELPALGEFLAIEKEA